MQKALKTIEHQGYVIEFTQFGTFLFPKDEPDSPEFSTRENLSDEVAKLIVDAYHAGWHRGKIAGRAELALQLRTLLEIKTTDTVSKTSSKGTRQ